LDASSFLKVLRDELGLGTGVDTSLPKKRLIRLAAVCVCAVSNSHDLYQESLVDDFVDDSVVPDSNPAGVVLTCHRDASRWPRVVRE
jgi:hypothetical protein